MNRDSLYLASHPFSGQWSSISSLYFVGEATLFIQNILDQKANRCPCKNGGIELTVAIYILLVRSLAKDIDWNRQKGKKRIFNDEKHRAADNSLESKG